MQAILISWIFFKKKKILVYCIMLEHSCVSMVLICLIKYENVFAKASNVSFKSNYMHFELGFSMLHAGTFEIEFRLVVPVIIFML